MPTDPYFANQFYLHNTGQQFGEHRGTAGADIKAVEAWAITKGSPSIVVAIIDGGVSADHPNIPSARQIRLPNSNLYDGDPNDPSPASDDNHGNACAGIIAASHNGEGIAGIAPNCKIMPVRIQIGDVKLDKYAKGINMAWDIGKADVISNSWNFKSQDPDLFAVITNEIDSAVLMVGMAGVA